MKTTRIPPLTPAQADALEARFARRLGARLDDSARQLPHDITERLRVARQQAVAHAGAQRGLAARPVGAPGVVSITAPAGWSLAGHSGNASFPVAGAASGGHGRRHERGDQDDTPSWGLRMASLLPLIALVGGLWAVHQWTQREQVQAAAEVDTALLTDDLPPAAYADPGFEEYLLGSNDASATALPMSLPGQGAVTGSSTLDAPAPVDGIRGPMPLNSSSV